MDARSELISVMGPDGPRRASEADLRRSTTGWRLTEATPTGIAEMLKTSRDLYCSAVTYYDFFVVGVVWSLMAVEGALRERYAADDKVRLFQLIKRAQTEGLMEEAWIERLEAARKLRNGFVHARQTGAWSPGMASGAIAASHELVARLLPDEDPPCS
ncbi:hypothetical protein F1C76_00715 [Geodermatophilaceae bacterium NBWT11]|nr:hypothetical protein F1C76_00715 [Geodermatophilaceae bacterium NBWT11]